MKSTLTYERLNQGEVGGDLTPEDKSRLQTLAEEDRQFLRRHPASEGLKRAAGRRPQPSALWGIPWAAALVAAVGLAVLVPVNDTRAKGSAPELTLYYRKDGGSAALAPGSSLKAGDEVQLVYREPQAGWGAIYSVDGRGHVTVHLPLHGSQAQRLETSGPQLLPYAYSLDDAPEFEVFYLVTSETPFEVPQVVPFLTAVPGAPAPAVPADLTVASFTVKKQETTP